MPYIDQISASRQFGTEPLSEPSKGSIRNRIQWHFNHDNHNSIPENAFEKVIANVGHIASASMI